MTTDDTPPITVITCYKCGTVWTRPPPFLDKSRFKPGISCPKCFPWHFDESIPEPPAGKWEHLSGVNEDQ